MEKEHGYCNIFECGRNLLDQLDVTYQQAFMESQVQDGLYQPSPSQERYYDEMAESLIEAKFGSDGTINDENLHKAIIVLKSKEEAEHEHNILNITQVDDYKSPWKDKYATTVNNTVYTFLNSYDDEISDSSKEVETSKETIKDTHFHDTSVGTTSVDSVITGVGIIGRGGPRAINRGSITQGMIHGVESIIISNVITHVLKNSSKMILKSNLFPFNPLKSKTLVIALLTEPFLSCDRDIRASSEI